MDNLKGAESRTIKFRAWDKKRKFFLGAMAFGGSVTPCEDKERTVFLNHHEYIILMQFTGLQDKNGKDIYEGDIINIHQTVNGQKLFVVKDCLSRLDVRYALNDRKYEYDQYELLDYKGDESEKEIEVIGNIYEHPHLLPNEQEDNRSVARNDATLTDDGKQNV